MRKVLSLLAIVVVLFAATYYSITTNNVLGISKTLVAFKADDIFVLYVEYVRISENWFKYTYYSDGSIGIEPIAHPPLD
ncbi:MAG TPA: hypothetical protein VN514_04130 [Ignavibacteria bacterium]|nr:hypothetical protein [Ignavibacteria bacterium]